MLVKVNWTVVLLKVGGTYGSVMGSLIFEVKGNIPVVWTVYRGVAFAGSRAPFLHYREWFLPLLARNADRRGLSPTTNQCTKRNKHQKASLSFQHREMDKHQKKAQTLASTSITLHSPWPRFCLYNTWSMPATSPWNPCQDTWLLLPIARLIISYPYITEWVDFRNYKKHTRSLVWTLLNDMRFHSTEASSNTENFAQKSPPNELSLSI